MISGTIDHKPRSLKSGKPDFAKTGWHEHLVKQSDGKVKIVWTPLTEAEFLHPREGDHLPSNTFHARLINTLKELLGRWFSHQPDTCVYTDLLIKWDIKLGDHCPDIFVVFGVKEPERDRSKFVIAEEGVRPSLAIEIVSPHYRRADRKTKVRHYEKAKVQEYLIFDRRRSRKQQLEEVVGYRLTQSGVYKPIPPDGTGRIFSQVLGLWVSLRQGQVVLEDPETGARLLTGIELEHVAKEERQRAEEERQRAEAADQRAEEERQRAERLASFLRSQGLDPDQV